MPVDIFHFLFALFLTGLVGFAIQRGGTCTVAAIDEIIRHGRIDRFAALMEASLWVMGGLLVFWTADIATQPLISWNITSATIVGAFLLGLGAVINGACMVGTISRIGNFEWIFFLTILGFFAGVSLFHGLELSVYLPAQKDREAFKLIPVWFAMLIVIGMVVRLYQHRKAIWGLRMATIIIAVVYLLLLLDYGPWAFTDLLTDLVNMKMDLELLPRLLLFIALLGGAFFGGLSNKTVQGNSDITFKGALKRFTGGALMGAGGIMIPGSHDSLILFYLPLLLPFAWVAFTVMIATIALSKYWIHHQMQAKA